MAGPGEGGGPWALESTMQRVARAVEKMSGLGGTVDAFNKNVSAAGQNYEDASKTAKKSSVDIARAYEDGAYDFKSKLGSTDKAFGTLVTSVLGGSETVGKLASKAGFTVGAISSLTEAGLNLNRQLVDAYQSGVIFDGGLRQVAQSFSQFNLSSAEFSKLVTTYSGLVTKLGMKSFQDLGARVNASSAAFAELGLTTQESQDLTMQYAEMLRQTGRLQGKSVNDIVKGSIEFNKQVTSIAQATGESTDAIRKQIIGLQTSGSSLALMATYGKQVNEGFLGIAKAAGKSADALNNMVQRVLMGGLGIAGLSDQQFEMLSYVPGALDTIQAISAATEAGNSELAAQLTKQLGEQIDVATANKNVQAAAGFETIDALRGISRDIKATQETGKAPPVGQPVPLDQTAQDVIKAQNAVVQLKNDAESTMALAQARTMDLLSSSGALAEATTGLTKAHGVAKDFLNFLSTASNEVLLGIVAGGIATYGTVKGIQAYRARKAGAGPNEGIGVPDAEETKKPAEEPEKPKSKSEKLKTVQSKSAAKAAGVGVAADVLGDILEGLGYDGAAAASKIAAYTAYGTAAGRLVPGKYKGAAEVVGGVAGLAYGAATEGNALVGGTTTGTDTVTTPAGDTVSLTQAQVDVSNQIVAQLVQLNLEMVDLIDTIKTQTTELVDAYSTGAGTIH